MKSIDDIYIKNGDADLVERQMYQDLLKEKKKQIEDLLMIINKYQKGIYYDEDEIQRIKKHNRRVDSKTKEQLKIIKLAVSNLNSNLNPNVQINI